MKKIIVSYWHLSKYPDLEYDHNSEYVYSIEKQREISETIISKGYSVMLRSSNDGLVICIDKGYFRQR